MVKDTGNTIKLGTDGAARFNRVSSGANAAIALLFIALALIAVLPVLFVLVISLTSEAAIATDGYSFFPKQWSTYTYEYLWREREMILSALMNSILITLDGTLLGLVFSTTMGYALSRPAFKLKRAYTLYIFVPMLFSGGLVASYMINTQVFFLRNTYWALVLPISCSSFYIIIMRTFFQTTIPDSIIESAKLDGARQTRIFTQIVLPISLPALATIGLFFTFGYWNDWFQAKLYLDTNRKDLYPLQYTLISIEKNIEFLTRNAQYMGSDAITQMPGETIRMAIVMVVVAPIACSYPFFQKYFISGLTIGAVKG